VARKWTYPRPRHGRPGVRQDIRRLVLRMATDNPQWGYTRIQGALKKVGRRVARSRIANIVWADGLPPRGERPTAWRTFLQAHWPMIIAADFFTTEGLDRSRAGDVLHVVCHRVALTSGSSGRHHATSIEAFMIQAMRHLTDGTEGVMRAGRVLICDRDPKWK
jgi:putative transposase